MRRILGRIACALFLLQGLASAATIANWKEMNPAITPGTANLDTDGPTFGDGTAADAESAFIAGRFGTVASPASVTLAVGETLVVSGNLVLAGGANGNRYRFGVFNDGGKFAADDANNWIGGWLHTIGNDLFQGRTNGVFLSGVSNAVDLNASKVINGSVDGDGTTAFTFRMAITRDSATTVDIGGSFVGGDSGFSQFYTVSDVTTTNFSYTAVGFLFDGSSSVDQGVFSNVQYSVSNLGSSVSYWREMNSGAFTADLLTDGPTFGNGNNANAQNSFIAGQFGAPASPVTATLAQGQALIVTGNLVLTGSSSGNNYRFGIYNDGGKFDLNSVNNWAGGWMHQIGGDLYQGNTSGNYLTVGGNAVDLNASKTSSGSVNGNSAIPFAFRMSITRDSATTVDLISSIIGGGSSLNQVYRKDDVTTALFTYTTFGVLYDGASSVDKSVFSNVQYVVNAVPTFSAFAAAVDSTNAGSVAEITLAKLLAQGDEADADGTVDAFVVQALSTGSLTIGPHISSATPFVAGSNDTIDASNNAYWTSVPGASGSGINAFTVIAQDNNGSQTTAPVQATVDVNTITALFVDFGQDTSGDSPLQAGFEGFNRTGNGSATKIQTFTNALGVAGTVDVTLTNPTHYRDYPTVTGGLFVAQSNLLSDMVLRNSNGTMVLTISDLQPGSYQVTTYHHGTSLGGGIFVFTATDALGADRALGTHTGSAGRTPSEITSLTNGFKVDNAINGGNIDLKFTGGGGSLHINLNGFQLRVSTDTTAPSISAVYPLDDDSDIQTDQNLEITFDEAIVLGTGNIVIKRVSDDSVVETIDVTSGAVTISGIGNLAIIDPVGFLPVRQDLYVEIDPGAFQDGSSNAFPGITGNSTWNFRTVSSDSAFVQFKQSSTANDQKGWRSVVDGAPPIPGSISGGPFNGVNFNVTGTHTRSHTNAGYSLVNHSDGLLGNLLSGGALTNNLGVDITLTLSGLADGQYRITTYHHTPWTLTSPSVVFDTLLTDALVTNSLIHDNQVISSGDTVTTAGLRSLVTEFTISGGGSVTLTFDPVTFPGASDQLNLNGFKLATITRTVFRFR